jgi:hypothetical protein
MRAASVGVALDDCDTDESADMDHLVSVGCIDEPERDLVRIVETGAEAAQIVLASHERQRQRISGLR